MSNRISHVLRVMAAFASPRYIAGSKFVGAGGLIFDPDGNLLLIRHRLRRGWEYPAGGASGTESPEATCAREVFEEVGLRLTGYRLVGVHFRDGWAPNGHVFFTFMATVTAEVTTQVRLDRLEAMDCRWVSRAQALELVKPKMKLRFEAIFNAVDQQSVAYAHE